MGVVRALVLVTQYEVNEMIGVQDDRRTSPHPGSDQSDYRESRQAWFATPTSPDGIFKTILLRLDKEFNICWLWQYVHINTPHSGSLKSNKLGRLPPYIQILVVEKHYHKIDLTTFIHLNFGSIFTWLNLTRLCVPVI